MGDSQSENAMLRGVLHGLLEWWPVLAKIEEAIIVARRGLFPSGNRGSRANLLL